MEKEINASISCMGYGYQVKILVNGVDIGVKGGMSESKRLFNTDHPMRKEATPEMQEHLFVLKPGENKLHIEAKKTGGETDNLSVDLYVGGGLDPFLTFKSSDPEANFDQTVTL